MTPLHISAINRQPPGDVSRKERLTLIHQSYITVLKIYNMDIMPSTCMLLKYSRLKFIDTLLFTVCVLHV